MATFSKRANYSVVSECGEFQITFSDLPGMEVYQRRVANYPGMPSVLHQHWLGRVHQFSLARKIANLTAKREVVFPHPYRDVESDCGRYSITAMKGGRFHVEQVFSPMYQRTGVILGDVGSWELAVALTED